ncbi:MAG: hypothetical protein U0575_00995 [Phycisphaerales bacterium]
MAAQKATWLGVVFLHPRRSLLATIGITLLFGGMGLVMVLLETLEMMRGSQFDPDSAMPAYLGVPALGGALVIATFVFAARRRMRLATGSRVVLSHCAMCGFPLTSLRCVECGERHDGLAGVTGVETWDQPAAHANDRGRTDGEGRRG